MIDEQDQKLMTYKTLCGALLHHIHMYGGFDKNSYDWQKFCSHMSIPIDSSYRLLEMKKGVGFILQVDKTVIKYLHNDIPTERVVQIVRSVKKGQVIKL